MGWDAFGLPTENFAIKNHVHPADGHQEEHRHASRASSRASVCRSTGTREINTTDPSYYKWTQWIFLQLFKKGLAYKKEMPCKLVYLLQMRSGERGGCQRRL